MHLPTDLLPRPDPRRAGNGSASGAGRRWPAILLALASAAAAEAQELVTVQTRPGVLQAYFLASAPRDPQAVAVLFPGSGGDIRLRVEDGQIKFSQGNFLVRSRAEFVKRGIVIAIVDAPSDQQGRLGMSDEFRLGETHSTDIVAVVDDLKRRFPEKPVFLVGTSRGSVSAAALGARLGERIAGTVLTATMFLPAGRRAELQGPGLSGFDFSSVKVPLLLVHHREDACVVTRHSDAARLSSAYPLISVSGGLPPKSEPCEPFSAHGFFGKEAETVAEIVNWMLKRPFRKEID
jgi:alpha-beta hydrolase superfamily lysophospholipase